MTNPSGLSLGLPAGRQELEIKNFILYVVYYRPKL